MSEELGYSKPVDAPEKPKSSSTRDVDDFLKTARDRFDQAQQAEKPQRQRELEDLRFYAGDQWPDQIKTAREGQSAQNGLPPVPARPCLTINKTREPVRQVLNQERQSEMGIELVPADDFGELTEPIPDTEIELREGLIRRIQRDSQANDARTWAFSRACISGRGYYRIVTEYVSGKTFDQEIKVQRIYNQSSVTLDPAHEQPDGSDAKWAFIGTYMPWTEYKTRFPKTKDNTPNKVADADDEAFKSLGEQYPEWFTMDGDTRACRVVDYFYTEPQSVKLCLLERGETVEEQDVPEGATIVSERTEMSDVIKWAQIDGVQILDETDWAGKYIPIVKVVGDELQPYDKERRVEGMVRPAIDAQRSFNYMVSKWVEMIGLAPIPPWMVAEGQIEGYEQWYELSTTRTLPYLPFKTRDLEGNQVGAPIRTPTDIQISPVAASVQMFDEAIQSTTGVHDPSVGKADPSLRSGRAIAQIVQQGQQSTSNYTDNLQRSIRYEGLIINDLLYPIYNRPGRIARLIDPHGNPTMKIVGKPMVMQQGKPQVAPEGTQGAQTFSLTPDANFNLVVKVTKAYETRRSEEAQLVGEMISQNPQLMTVFGDLFFKSLDSPGHTEMAERAKLMLAPPIQQMLNQGGGHPPDPQMLAAMQQGQQQMQALNQQLQQAQQVIQTKQIESQARLTEAKIGADKDIALQRMRDATSIAVAEINARAKGVQSTNEGQMEAQALAQEQAHEVGLQAHDQAHQAQMTQMQQQHQAQLAQQQAQNQQQMAAQQAAQQQAPQQTSGQPGAAPVDNSEQQA